MKKKDDEQELVFGQRFDTSPREVTYKDFESDPAPKTRRERFNDKFIKRENGSGFARRGTVGARRAENKERARNRAKQMAKARRNK